MAHEHTVVNTDARFTIDPVSRTIAQMSGKTKLMQYDHNSERYEFELKRYLDNHDMLKCNRVRIDYINIGAGGKQHADIYEVKDLAADADNPSIIHFSWLVSQNATQYAGALNFLIQFACIGSDGSIEYLWHTDVFEDIAISAGMNNAETVITSYSDILAQWRNDLFGVGDTVEASITARGEAVLASLPNEYTALQNQVHTLDRSRAPAIFATSEGEAISVSDSSDCYVKNLRVFGKSVQDGVPTPDAPVEIASVESPQIDIYGANLANLDNLTLYSNTSLNVSEDGYTIKAIGGSSKGYTSSTTYLNSVMLAGRSVIFKADSISSTNSDAKAVAQLNIFTSNNKYYEAISSTELKRTIAIPADTYEITLGVYTNNNSTALSSDNTVVAKGVGVYLSDVEWEPCRDKQTIVTSELLHAVPVSSGGNYTDENGQQWVCDEIDFERKTRIRRIQTIAFDGTEEWYINNIDSTPSNINRYFIANVLPEAEEGGPVHGVLCNAAIWSGASVSDAFSVDGSVQAYGFTAYPGWIGFAMNTADYPNVESFKAKLAELYNAGTPVTVYVANRTEPIEVPLTDEELNSFRELHTNFPNTNVLNNKGAHMELEYIADTKTYIDNRLGDLS